MNKEEENTWPIPLSTPSLSLSLFSLSISLLSLFLSLSLSSLLLGPSFYPSIRDNLKVTHALQVREKSITFFREPTYSIFLRQFYFLVRYIQIPRRVIVRLLESGSLLPCVVIQRMSYAYLFKYIIIGDTGNVILPLMIFIGSWPLLQILFFDMNYH